MSLDSDVSTALDALERSEFRFLTWGILDQALTRSEVEAVIARATGRSPAEVLDELLRRRLIFEVRRSSPPTYRSRMAEGVRLFAHMRQQFEQRPWEAAARLVADFRFLVQPRRFPMRVLNCSKVEEVLGGLNLSRPSQSALRALLDQNMGPEGRLLSQFQVDASAEILRGLANRNDQACIVTAGTGSGKTLAFYLPTLLHLVADPDRGNGTRVLAVYPRNELLKDQLLATIREVRRMRAADPSLPSIRIGAYFGPTPLRGGLGALPSYLGWRESRQTKGSICPFLVCPGPPGGDGCGAPLEWSAEDRRADRSTLSCLTCGSIVSGDELALTRSDMQKAPPDILFTTTEMLNRSLMDDWSAHVFGVGPRATVRPRLVLLDEVHTYSGPSGAQAAYVLRRWRQLAGGPVMWVGLSATLREAEQFFGKLTGVPADFVREVTPAPEDLEQRGHEYQLLLRGDPTSQTALLSTSIQALLLLLRLMDPLGTMTSGGAFGSKVFAFCDNLDLTNRLFRQLLDAEGRDPIGKVDPKKSGSLALLRSQDHHPSGNDITDWPDRDLFGQQWWLVDELRESAVPPMIGRTSSQDSGVTAAAETIVATASLEVGFDDPEVGAVLQHKAPRDLAQFVQRRGRAGRSQSMRPWTVVVLSDYGRDRLAYQSYERLFDPLLPPKSLPLANRSIQRMQAMYASMDWAAEKVRRMSVDRGTIRDDLSVPQTGKKRIRQQRVAELLAEVLESDSRRFELTSHIQRSLRLSAEEVEILLWEGPRSVLLEAIPTAVRRMKSEWHVVREGQPIPGGDRQRRDHPLPEFVPANLFSDLCLPEIQIVSPSGYDESAETEEPVFLALNQFAPGNVTLRYAVWKTKGLWVDPGVNGGRLDISATLLQDGDTVAQVQNAHGDLVEVVRPFSIHPVIPDREVQTTSSGRFFWNARVNPIHEAIEVDLPIAGPWSQMVVRTDFYLQAGRGGVKLLRYTFGGTAEVGRDTSGKARFRYELARGEDPIALGVELDVDALRVRIRPPEDVAGYAISSDPRRLRQLRRDHYLWLVVDAMGAAEGLNPFLANWLGELTLTAIAIAAGEGQGTVDPSAWTTDEWRDRILEAFDRAFQGLQDDQASGGSQTPLREAVESAIGDVGVSSELGRLFEMVIGPPDAGWQPWLQSRFSVTVAAAVHAAIQALLTDFDADLDLAVDLVEGDGHVDIWITDVAVGGGGLIEALHSAYAEDPRRFWNLCLGALEPDELEQAAEMLHRVVVGLAEGDLAPLADAYRRSSGGEESLRTWRELLRSIAQSGIPPSHALTVALATRIVRPGSSMASDRALHEALGKWADLETELGFALDQRTACVLLAADRSMQTALSMAAPPGTSRSIESWAFNVLLGLLWSSPEEVRNHTLQPPMPFDDRQPRSERTLVLEALGESDAVVRVENETWRAEADAQLASTGRCVLSAPYDDETLLHRALIDVMVDPTEVGSLHLHPRVVGLRRRANSMEAVLELMEAPQ